ncbi:hypothetical protein ACFWY6_31705 [Streptomyces sp. NPDC059037]|uniref:hypothetical protein n=1 Tax=Streptomyces sp. NPDC059037 TaxID=3346710 RepID=UPI0036C227D1
MITAVAAVIAVIAIGSALVQALGGSGDVSGPSPSPVTPGSGGTLTESPTESPTGTSAAPVITLSTQGFEKVHINPGSKAQTVDFTVTNPNGQAIVLDSTDIPDDTGFARAGGTCTKQLEARASCKESAEQEPCARIRVTTRGLELTASILDPNCPFSEWSGSCTDYSPGGISCKLPPDKNAEATAAFDPYQEG